MNIFSDMIYNNVEEELDYYFENSLTRFESVRILLRKNMCKTENEPLIGYKKTKNVQNETELLHLFRFDFKSSP